MGAEKHAMPAWQLMKEAKTAIGLPALNRIFSLGNVQINKFCRNPDYTADSARTPIERLRILLHDLDDAGAKDVAHAMLNYMARGLSMHCVPFAEAVPDKGDISAECLDDLPPLVALHERIRAGADVREVRELAEEAKREIDETVTLYVTETEGE